METILVCHLTPLVTSIASEEQHASDKGEEDDDLLFSKADDAIVDILSFLFQALSMDEAEEDGMKKAASKSKGAPKRKSITESYDVIAKSEEEQEDKIDLSKISKTKSTKE